MHRWILVRVWLTRDEPAGLIAVHIGAQRVGSIARDETGAFDQVFQAAALFDEDPVALARLWHSADTATVVLEVPRPVGS